MRVKKQDIKKLSQWVKPLAKVLDENCDAFALLRGKLYCSENGNVCIDFLAVNSRGGLCSPNLEIVQETGDIYYDRGSTFNFKDTQKVVNQILSAVEYLVGFGVSIGAVYFDISDRQNIDRVYMINSLIEKGSKDFFMEATMLDHSVFIITDSESDNILSCDWSVYANVE